MPVKSKAKINAHILLARKLIRYLYGNKKSSISSLSGGLSNYVFAVKMPGDDLVVRMSDKPEKITAFLKEQWVVDLAGKNKIPVPEILEVGNQIIPVPYMIIRKVQGEAAINFSDRKQLLMEMGHYTAKINAIPTHNFGNEFDWSGNTLSKNISWKEYLHKELNVMYRLNTLIKYKMLFSKSIKAIKALLEEMESWRKNPSLNHGDMRLKNIMIDKQGKIISILDWENCTSVIAPYWDLSIALHDLSIDEQEYYLQGYGIKPAAYNKMAPFIKTLNILHYAPLVQKLVIKKKFEKLANYRVRINGSMDMYSL
ncbi:MAG: phosphotransferase family protein [Chitinophagaceae bacterium]